MKLSVKSIKFNLETVFIVTIVIISTVINLHKIDTLMMFIGDMGRDFLAAREMIMTGSIPLVGIQSSVVWLHQGPLSIYLIGLSFLLSKFSPIAPAVMYALFGAATTFLVYMLGKEYFNNKIGLLSALFFATSPLIIVNVRMPYHSAPIPFFAAIFFLLVFKYLKGNKRLIFYVFLFFGLLLELELSNIVVAPVLLILYLIYKPNLDRKQIVQAGAGLLLGILPFVVYDTSHKFVQTAGLPLWALNRTRVFLGIAVESGKETAHVTDAIYRIYQQLVSAIFPFSRIISETVLVVVTVVILLRTKTEKNMGFVILLIWFGVPVVSYLIHKSPGTAYFPLLFPAISLLVGYSVYQISRKFKFVILLFILGCGVNLLLVVKNNYFLHTHAGNSSIPPLSYSIGPSYSLQEEAIDAVLLDSKGKEISIKGGGFLSTLATGVDNFIYIAKYKGANVSSNARIIYTIYNAGDTKIPENRKPIFKNNYFVVIKDEA